MVTFILQSLFLIAAAFIIGAILGNVFKRFAPNRESTSQSSTRAANARLASATVVPVNDDVKKPAAETATMTPPAEPVPAKADNARSPQSSALRSPARQAQPKPVSPAPRNPRQNDKDRPALLKNARRGKPDKLASIDGIGSVIESKLYALGVFHYDQIARWSAEEASWISDEIGFAGRAVRENWVKQAAALAKPAPIAPKKAGKKV